MHYYFIEPEKDIEIETKIKASEKLDKLKLYEEKIKDNLDDTVWATIKSYAVTRSFFTTIYSLIISIIALGSFYKYHCKHKKPQISPSRNNTI